MDKAKLIELGLSEDLAGKVMGWHKEATKDLAPKLVVDELKSNLEAKDAEIKERDKQISALKKFEGDKEGLQKKLEELEEANKARVEEYTQKLAQERRLNAVKLSLFTQEGARPHDVGIVLGLLNLDDIRVSEGGVIESGLKEQYDKLKAEKPFLFAQSEQGKPAPNFQPQGSRPAEGVRQPSTSNNSQGGSDYGVNFGKSLAQAKLGMFGISTKKES